MNITQATERVFEHGGCVATVCGECKATVIHEDAESINTWVVDDPSTMVCPHCCRYERVSAFVLAKDQDKDTALQCLKDWLVKEQAMNDPDAVTMFVIYDHPSDYPESFVVRQWVVSGDHVLVSPVAQLAETIEAARAKIPLGRVKLKRTPDDDPVILEVWL
jgi:hypothetical protein